MYVYTYSYYPDVLMVQPGHDARPAGGSLRHARPLRNQLPGRKERAGQALDTRNGDLKQDLPSGKP